MSNQQQKIKWSGRIFLLLVFFGALFWAKSDDPFRRIEFTLKTPSYGKVKGMVVLPKPVRQCPVVVYMHGSGGSLMASGTDLRQLAELGLVAVGMEYSQTNEAAFDEQFLALSQYLQQQPWAMKGKVAWVGFSLGAQRTLGFVLRHPEIQPQLLVRMSGGWITELDSVTNVTLHCPVLLINGEKDAIFPVEDANRLAELLRTNGVAVTEKVMHGKDHSFTPDRGLVNRLVAEYCRSTLLPAPPFQGLAEKRKMPFVVYLFSAFGWAMFCFYRWWQMKGNEKKPVRKPLTRWDKALRGMACFLAIGALVETGIHLVTPQLAVSDRTLRTARHLLVPPKMVASFDTAATNTCWQGKPLKMLLDNAELANYNRNELINWKLDEGIYRDYVLSPVITGSSDEQPDWRRPLWEEFYPRVRHENEPLEAARVVVRHLRKRVTIAKYPHLPQEAQSIWKRQITDPAGFEIIYVAALRSVGAGAKLNSSGRAEIWTGDKWVNAPRPVIDAF